jgi:hypothetical protein
MNATAYETANSIDDDNGGGGGGGEGFDDYTEQTTETGDIPLIVAVVFGIVTQFILLPILVVSRRHYLKKQKRDANGERDDCPNRNQEEQKQEEDEDSRSTRSVVVDDEETANHHGNAQAHDGHTRKKLPQEQRIDNADQIDLPAIFDADPTRHLRHATKVRRTADGRKRRDKWEGRISIMNRRGDSQEHRQVSVPIEDDHIELTFTENRRGDSQEHRQESVFIEDDHIELKCTEMPEPGGNTRPIGVDKREKMTTPGGSTCCRAILYESRILFQFDNEAKRILRLAVPFTVSELVDTVSEIVVLGVISATLGTDALSAFVVFETLMEITTEFSGGVVDAMTTLASQAYGAGNNVLVGQYVQLCSIAYVLFQVPFIFMWSFATFDIMIWMGFDEHVAQMAQTYGRLVVWRDTVLGVSEVYYNLFEVVEKEYAVAILGNTEALVELGAIAIALYLFGGDLVTVGVIEIVNGLCFFLFALAFTYWKGWLQPFAKGVFTSMAFKNRVAVQQVIKTATPLAFGSVLIHGEWEVLTVFAAYLGAAEVTAWAILGNLWDIFESSNE